MKISFSTLGCPRWSFKEITATAVDLGYQGIEVRGIGKDISVPSAPDFAPDALAHTLAELARILRAEERHPAVPPFNHALQRLVSRTADPHRRRARRLPHAPGPGRRR